MKRIEFSPSARKYLLKSDKNLSKKIVDKIEILLASPEQLNIKKLKNRKNLFRIRIGDYRVIFEIDSDVIFISAIGHRKDIYN